MSYDAKLMPQAQRDLERLRGKIVARLERRILGLCDEPRPLNSKKLRGGGSKWRIRTGDYRILYEIDDSHKIVRVYRVAHRKEAYR